VHRCLQSKAPKYLTDCCTPVSEIASRRHLRSASRHHLSVPRYQLTTTSAVEPSLLQAWWSGTLYYTGVSETRLSAAAISGNCSRRTSSTATQHTQRNRDAAWLHYINVRLTLTLTLNNVEGSKSVKKLQKPMSLALLLAEVAAVLDLPLKQFGENSAVWGKFEPHKHRNFETLLVNCADNLRVT